MTPKACCWCWEGGLSRAEWPCFLMPASNPNPWPEERAPPSNPSTGELRAGPPRVKEWAPPNLPEVELEERVPDVVVSSPGQEHAAAGVLGCCSSARWAGGDAAHSLVAAWPVVWPGLSGLGTAQVDEDAPEQCSATFFSWALPFAGTLVLARTAVAVGCAGVGVDGEGRMEQLELGGWPVRRGVASEAARIARMVKPRFLI